MEETEDEVVLEVTEDEENGAGVEPLPDEDEEEVAVVHSQT